MGNIETGVDRLVKLVNKEKKISLDAAAKKLGVPKEVVQEWADFLEEESLISVQYSLSKVFLEERRLSKKEVEKKAKEYTSKKEAFVRKVDTTLKKLESETAGFDQIKKQYYELKEEIGNEITQVKDEVAELRHYEDLKKNIDQDILKQKVDYEKSLSNIHKRISAEEQRYAKLLNEIGIEENRIQDEGKEVSDLKQQSSALEKRIDALKDIINSIKSQVESEEKNLDLHQERLITLKNLAETLEKDIKDKKEKEIEPLVASSAKHQEKILKVQGDIIEKIKARKSAIENYESQGEKIAKRFETFFNKKAKTEKLLHDLDKEKLNMQHELEALITKAKGFDLASKNADIKKHVKELEKKFDDFDKKRGAFSKKLKELHLFISGK